MWSAVYFWKPNLQCKMKLLDGFESFEGLVGVTCIHPGAYDFIVPDHGEEENNHSAYLRLLHQKIPA